MDPSELFTEQIRLAMYGQGRYSLKLAGIRFWFTGNMLIYDVSKKKWNLGMIAAELAPLIEAGYQRALAVHTALPRQ